VGTMRDLAWVDPWRESLERSLARRGKLPRGLIKPSQRRPQRDLAHDDEPEHEIPAYWLLCWRAVTKRWMMLVAYAGGLITFGLLAGTQPNASEGHGASARAAHVHASRAAVGSRRAEAGHAPTGSGAAELSGAGACQLAYSSTCYVNPLAGAAVAPRRIDQGVDYAGSGALTAIGPARITTIATSDTGGPGAVIEYQLLGGSDDGRYVFYAEGLTPAEGLYVGETVRAGQAIATIIPADSSGIEIGWGANDGTKTYAAEIGQWSAVHETDNIPTAAGENFSALIASLGGPPGKAEG
jgi:hypothetical protein